MKQFAKNELRRIYAHLTRLLPPGARPLRAEELVDVNDLLAKTSEMIKTSEEAVERGAKVFEWRIDATLAPTMNQYGHMESWQKKKIRESLADALQPILDRTRNALVHGEDTMRWVRVTRFTTQPNRIDERSVDAIGGKMAVDVLVKRGVLVGDEPKHLRREAIVEKTGKGNTHVLVEVFEAAREEVSTPAPAEVRVVQRELPRGAFAQHMIDATEKGSTKRVG